MPLGLIIFIAIFVLCFAALVALRVIVNREFAGCDYVGHGRPHTYIVTHN